MNTPDDSHLQAGDAQVANASDQNEIIRLNQRLAEMQARIRRLLTSLPLGLLLIGDNETIEASNSQVEELFGYDKYELADQPITFIFPDLKTMQVDPKPRREIGRRKGGETLACDVVFNDFEQDGFRRIFMHIQDVSERQRLEQLRQDFVAMVSHDLRTPLSSINMSLDMLRNGTCGDVNETTEIVVDQAKISCEYLMSLVTELLDSEKLQSSEFELDIQRTTVKSVVDKAILATQAACSESDISLETDFTNDMFWADENRIAQVLINLISNAIKYSPSRSKVVLRAGLEGTGVKFRVTDNGPGIPAELRFAIFERYRQLNQPEGLKRRGFGLGLSICKVLVEAHRGSISVDGKEGLGSTFEVFIPLIDEPD